MKAIQIKRTGAPEVLEYVEIERPSPEKGQVLVKIASASVNFADTMMRQGTYPMMPSLPVIPGLEYSGTIEAVGKDVTQLRTGQNVVVFGKSGYAEYAVAPAESVIPIPSELDKDVAAAFPLVYLTAYHMLHTMARVQAGQTILLHAAAGGVGTAVIQLARLAGVTIIGLTGSPEKVRYARDQGAAHIVNHKTENVTERVKQITKGRGVDVVLNSVAGDTFARDLEFVVPLGQIIWFGFAAGLPQENLVAQLAKHFVKSVGVRTFSIFSVAANPELMVPSMQTVLRYLMEEKIQPHIHESIPLSEAVRAHALLESSAVKGKLILKPEK